MELFKYLSVLFELFFQQSWGNFYFFFLIVILQQKWWWSYWEVTQRTMLPRLELMLTGKTGFPVSLKVTFPQMPNYFDPLTIKRIEWPGMPGALPGLLCSFADSVRSLSLQPALGLAVCRHSQVYSSVQVHRTVPGHCWDQPWVRTLHQLCTWNLYWNPLFHVVLLFVCFIIWLWAFFPKSTLSWKDIVAVLSLSKYKGCELHRNKLTCWTSWD